MESPHKGPAIEKIVSMPYYTAWVIAGETEICYHANFVVIGGTAGFINHVLDPEGPIRHWTGMATYFVHRPTPDRGDRFGRLHRRNQ